MQLVARPKLAKPLPKAFPRSAVEALLDTIAPDRESKRQTDWAERDLALILTVLLGGLRAEELSQANVIVQVKPTNPLLKQRRTSHGYPSTERTASHCVSPTFCSPRPSRASAQPTTSSYRSTLKPTITIRAAPTPPDQAPPHSAVSDFPIGSVNGVFDVTT
jgi:hypothetical protein